MDMRGKIEDLSPVLHNSETQHKAALCEIDNPKYALGSWKARHTCWAEHYIKPDTKFLFYSYQT